MKDETAAEQATDHTELTNAVGLHARPSVKLTQLAKPSTAALRLRYRSTDRGWTPRAR